HHDHEGQAEQHSPGEAEAELAADLAVGATPPGSSSAAPVIRAGRDGAGYGWGRKLGRDCREGRGVRHGQG
ncbi:MAG: hypothetical protein ACRYHQ_15220, partial [Janthinobacterium lividum]